RFDCPWDAGIASQGDGNLTVVDGLRVNDQELVIRVKLFADVGSGKVTREELRVAGQRLDLSRGRLVLLDFTRDRARWQQVDVDLSKALTGVDLRDVETMGTKGVAQIRQATPVVDEFFQ